MAIESAGEKKYYDFIADRMKRHRILDITWMSLICLAFLSLASEVEAAFFLGIMLLILGVAIGISNASSRKALSKKLNVIENKKKFFNQLVAKDTVEFKDLRLLITNDYLLKYSDDLYIYKFSEMKNVEIKGNRLYLLDYQNKKYEIAVNEKGKENSFDTACQLLAILV